MRYILLVLLFSCSNNNPSVLREVTQEDIDYCKPGCDYLMTLKGRDGNQGCEEARPLMFQNEVLESCEKFCQDTQVNGRLLNPKCWLTIKSCEEIESICRSVH